MACVGRKELVRGSVFVDGPDTGGKGPREGGQWARHAGMGA